MDSMVSGLASDLKVGRLAAYRRPPESPDEFQNQLIQQAAYFRLSAVQLEGFTPIAGRTGSLLDGIQYQMVSDVASGRASPLDSCGGRQLVRR